MKTKLILNSFSAILNIVVWDYFHIQYFKYFKKANDKINHKTVFVNLMPWAKYLTK